MSYYVNENPYGLDLDQFGNPLNTARNMDILAEVERQRAAAMYQPPVQQGYYPQQQAYEAYPRGGGFVERGRDSYYPEQVSSRESVRHMYTENRGLSRTNEPSGYYQNTDSSNGTAVPDKYGAAAHDNINTQSYPREERNGLPAREEVKESPSIKAERENRILIPYNGIYHWTLLPKRLREERVVIASKLLSEGYKLENNVKIKVSNIGDYYTSSIIKNEEDEMNGQYTVEDRFSEDLFLFSDEKQTIIDKIKIYPIRDKETHLIGVFSNNQLVNRLLIEMSMIPNMEKDTAYTFDYINFAKYYSSKSKNLFLEAAVNVNNFYDGVEALTSIYQKYSEQEVNLNSLRTIDAELTKDFLVFIRGFTGNENIKCPSFMQYAGKIHQAAESYVDMTAQRNIKAAIERFTNILFANIRKLKDSIDLGDDTGGMIVPKKEFSIITKNSKVKEELSSILESNESRFYLIDEGYSPELSRLITKIDSEKILSGYTKVTLFTINGLYQVIKTKGKGYYISLMDIYK